MLSKQQAAQLQSEIRDAITLTAAKIEQFTTGHGYKALGYPTFTAWWAAEMSDVPAASALTGIVYAMLGEGTPYDQIAATVKGVGPQTVAALARQFDNGVPPQLASTATKPAKHESYYGTLFLRIPTTTLKQWKKTADEMGTTVEDLALPVLAELFDGLGGDNAA